jgi:hypothetical protein
LTPGDEGGDVISIESLRVECTAGMGSMFSFNEVTALNQFKGYFCPSATPTVNIDHKTGTSVPSSKKKPTTRQSGQN